MKNKKFWIGLLTVACTLTSALALGACSGASGGNAHVGAAETTKLTCHKKFLL